MTTYKTPKQMDLDEVNAGHIRRVLAMANGRVNGPGAAAEILGANPSTLRHRMKRLGIQYGREREKQKNK